MFSCLLLLSILHTVISIASYLNEATQCKCIAAEAMPPVWTRVWKENSDITSKLVWPLAAPWGCDLDRNTSGSCGCACIVFWYINSQFFLSFNYILEHIKSYGFHGWPVTILLQSLSCPKSVKSLAATWICTVDPGRIPVRTKKVCS